MITLTLPLTDIILDAENNPDLTALDAAAQQALLAEAYAFLGDDLTITLDGDTVTITTDAGGGKSSRAQKAFDRATRLANRGRYEDAVAYFEKTLAIEPLNVDARRNLGMALMESGHVDAAEAQILNALKTKPDDPYSLLLMANLYVQHRRRMDVADRFYRRAVAADPEDVYILSNYATVLSMRDEHEAAEQYFGKALAIDPAYPNANFNLALSHSRRGQHAAALVTLDNLFAQPESMDIRTDPVYNQARGLYLQVSKELAATRYDEMMDLVRQLRVEIEEAHGVEIELVADGRINTLAKAEIAWHHNRARHVVRYQDGDAAVVPHLIAHELLHIKLESEARAADNNRFFTTDPGTRENALNAIRSDLSKLKRSGLIPLDMMDKFTGDIIDGLVNQLFNMPLDMVIEHRLKHDHPALAATQFASLAKVQQDNLQALRDPNAKAISPRQVFNANTAMNAAYALFTDWLYSGATAYGEAYEGTRHLRDGRKLFAIWLESYEERQPGDEYDMVDKVAAELRLESWFAWRPDEELPAEEVGGTTNEDLLQAKGMAATMYCLGALQRFDPMSRDDIFPIVSEIAMMGQGGIDYADSEQKYTLNSLPGETFSGLQLLCLMYVGFKDIQPDMDTGIDLREPYEMALKMHEGGQ